MSVKLLARWIASEMEPDKEGLSCLEIDRDWSLDPDLGLSRKTSEELITLHGRLCRAIPDDVYFVLNFEDGFVHGRIEYRDGDHAGFGMGFPVSLDRHLLNALREYDWDNLRGIAIQGSQLQDNVADLAATLPSRIPSIAVIQDSFSGPIKQFESDKRLAKYTYSLLSCNPPDEDEIKESTIEFNVSTYENRENLIYEMGDLMACGCIMVAIMENGISLSADQVAEIRQEVLDGLGPISRAKAEGNFDQALAMMQTPF